jgi:hypothetical protein
MASRSRLRKKVAPEFTPAPTQNVVQSRPFTPPSKSEIAPTLADVQAQLDHAQHSGHHLANYAQPQSTPIIQAKLTIGAPGDKYEQEADRVAGQVVQQLHSPQMESPEAQQSVQREAMPEEDDLQMKPLVDQIQRAELPEDDELQMKPDGLQRESLPEEDDELQMKPMLQMKGGGAISADAELETAIQQSRGSGTPLADKLRQPMEHAFGNVDFSGVKVHTDAQADQFNRSIQAKAFTTGQDIFFRQGEYQPDTRSGKELLAHELTHVVQQGMGGGRQVNRISSSGKGSIQRKMEQDRLNVVGEIHTESDKRRDEEKRFSCESVGSSNYWGEQEFPVFGGNKGDAEQGDMAEYRAMHSGTYIAQGCTEASKAAQSQLQNVDDITSALKGGFYTQEKSRQVMGLIWGNVSSSYDASKKLIDRAMGAYAPTKTPELNKVYDELKIELNQTQINYLIASKPNASLMDMVRAIYSIASLKLKIAPKINEMRKLTGISTPRPGDKNEGEEEIMLTRSRTMAIAAGLSNEKGTWKIGDAHIDDLRKGRVKVRMGNPNFMTRQEFNLELKEWKLHDLERMSDYYFLEDQLLEMGTSSPLSQEILGLTVDYEMIQAAEKSLPPDLGKRWKKWESEVKAIRSVLDIDKSATKLTAVRKGRRKA